MGFSSHFEVETLFFGPTMIQQKIMCLFVLLSDVPASAMYFASYEVIMRFLVPAGGSRDDLSFRNSIFAGKFNFTKKKIFSREMP